MRTELRFGEAAGELTRQLAVRTDQMLVLGIGEAATLTGAFATLLATARSPVLVVYSPAEVARRREPQRAQERRA